MKKPKETYENISEQIESKIPVTVVKKVRNISQLITQVPRKFKITKTTIKDVEVELTDEPPIIKKFESDYIKKK